MTPGSGGWREARVEDSVYHTLIQFWADIPLVLDLIVDQPNVRSPAFGSTGLGDLGLRWVVRQMEIPRGC